MPRLRSGRVIQEAGTGRPAASRDPVSRTQQCWHCSPRWTGWRCWHCGREAGTAATDTVSVNQEAEQAQTPAHRAIAEGSGSLRALKARKLPDGDRQGGLTELHPHLVVDERDRICKVYEDVPGGSVRIVTAVEWAAILGPWGKGKAHYFWNLTNNRTQWEVPEVLATHVLTYQ